MLSLKKSPEEDVDSLIDSMLRLIEYMNSNPTFKQDIFKSFSHEDLNKILKNMEDQNQKLRKVSCLFLCSILTNLENCEKFCMMLSLMPIAGKLSLTMIPDKLARIFSQNPGMLKQISNASVQVLGNEPPFSWYYSIQMSQEMNTQIRSFYQSQIRNLKVFFQDFPDPAEALVGVFYSPQRTTTLTNNYLNTTIYPQTQSPVQQYAICRTEAQSVSPQLESYQRKSMKSYGQGQSFVTPTSPVPRQTPSPSSQIRPNKENPPKLPSALANTTNTSITNNLNSYAAFLNAQRLKLENTRYSEKTKLQSSTKQVNKAEFDILKQRLSDNMQNSNKSQTQQKQTASKKLYFQVHKF